MIKPYQVKNFLISLFWHIYSGYPKASKEQILYRFGICRTCEFFDTKNNQCLQCGCFVNDRKIFMNKLAWGDQQCPINKWDKINTIS
ncbi:hypothetical protein EB118_18140 [bacterium]|nr:hypothetical protein [bacterium]NDC95845.1 hypothetical protein [bacterium]NDD85528.1 hypothetical protein [bacterium]NDG31980.1 hypothetical protein [bacterium]